MRQFLLTLALVGTVGTASYALPNKAEVIPAQGGNILITPIYHASMQIEYRGYVIQVDPFSAGDYTGAKKADLILITHTHPDHLDVKQILKLLKPGWRGNIIAPPAATAQLAKAGLRTDPHPQPVGAHPFYAVTTITNNSSMSIGTARSQGTNQNVSVGIEAVPAYNLKRGPKPGVKYHPKGEFNGYILRIGDKYIYIAGDTEVTPEMKAHNYTSINYIDVAFLPMNLPYTMTPQEAAVGARAFKPKVVYPYHYRYPFTKPNDNPQQFAKAMAGSGVVVKIRDWYGHPAK